jgi:hypothetical protein
MLLSCHIDTRYLSLYTLLYVTAHGTVPRVVDPVELALHNLTDQAKVFFVLDFRAVDRHVYEDGSLRSVYWFFSPEAHDCSVYVEGLYPCPSSFNEKRR